MQGVFKTYTQYSPINSLSQNAQYILEKRYLLKDSQGLVIETPGEMCRRVARAVASAELKYDPKADIKKWEDAFCRLMLDLEFSPNSSTLLNAGRESGQLSACFVLPVNDSLDSILETIKKAALIHKSGGGTGFSFSRIRPEGSIVSSMGAVASGPVPFIRMFSAVTGAVRQGGIRRGCNIATLNVNHPDILKFIMMKNDPDVLTNFYTSVVVSDEFMQAARDGTNYNLINPRTREVSGKLNAREVFKRIVAQSWRTGDPGMVFINRIKETNPTPQLGEIESVCGCGEQMLLPYESCNLGSINLARMLRCINGATEINYPKVAATVRKAVRFLDNVIDVNKYPIATTEEATKKTRKIGLGVMGFADMLIQLGIPYGSNEALSIGGEIMCFINKESHKASAALAEERGVFPTFKGSIYDANGGPLLRNASCTTIAPTGTLSLIAGCSSGIEPNFAPVFVRYLEEGEQLLEVNRYFEEVAKRDGFYSEELMEKLACGNGLNQLEDIPHRIKQLFATSIEIEGEWHVKMQAAFQKHTDSAISKTVNLPLEATLKDVATIYMIAYQEGLKGITVYRDGSRKLQPLCNNSIGLRLMRKRLRQQRQIPIVNIRG